jgi:uncharacterized coiled-coil DUF342 family protein
MEFRDYVAILAGLVGILATSMDIMCAFAKQINKRIDAVAKRIDKLREEVKDLRGEIKEIRLFLYEVLEES